MSLTDHLVARIRATGPITIADYMAECLLHPTFGYYTTRDPFGAKGDFTTAPEISQMFGELIGLALARSWLDQGAPARFTLAELGPGRGTLMADVLRATARVPGFDKAGLHLVEASPTLRARQRQALAAHSVRWLDTVDELPEAPLFLIANEFFDALPIRQFQRAAQGWSERQIGLDGDRLTPGLGAPGPQPALARRLGDTGEGEIVELCPAAPAIVAQIARRIAQHGGAALLIDYGNWRSRGDTLQAVRDHRFARILDTPGQSDLTAHVAFEPLALAARAAGAAHSRMTSQGTFLERLGITARAQALAARGGDAVAAAHRRLTHPDEMGNLFQVLGLFPPGAPCPAGLEP
ncbi:MAG: SAM-dependent methyltransferase [Pseudooceanicola sp.]|nr:SAM-dependent methyltransferase [Pseudooceanicola sp.]